MRSPLNPIVIKLLIPIRMLLDFLLLGGGFQRVTMLSQQAANHRQAYCAILGIETLSNIHQSTVEPLVIAQRITRCVRRYNVH
jgi:hypothetical protein